MSSLTIILPTFNEVENIPFLVKDIAQEMLDRPSMNLSVLVVDDNSTDGTQEVVLDLESKFEFLRLIGRTAEPSLPNSIAEGICHAKSDFVSWLDADGSMPISVLFQMWDRLGIENLDFIVGSRFVEGGGFKGVEVSGKTPVKQIVKNIRESEDSLMAVVLSRVLNELLRLILPCRIRDLTSGFVISRTNLIEHNDVSGSYGDYCPKLLYKLSKKTDRFVEHPYICLPRVSGVSKTGTNLRTYIRRGLPYLTSSLRARFNSIL